VIEETYLTARGRQRRRPVRVDLDEVRRGLGLPGVADRSDWEQIRKRLRASIGESSFEVWLEPLELIAIDRTGALVIAAAPAMCSWVSDRFGRLLSRCSQAQSRELRLADERERRALAGTDPAPAVAGRAVQINQQEVS
jgi:chromosomal replication initiation ATPase DnaA